MKRSYSRRELYALGEPLGDSATYRKAGGLVLGDGGGGGGGSAPADKTTQTVELPEWARPYAKNVLAKGAALTDINQNPYQQYGGNRIAGFSPMQMQSFQGAANMDAGPRGFQENVGGYMSPYMQNVVDVEKRGAIRDYQIGNTMQQAQATQAGAFGGGREAIQRAERERGLMGTLGGIQARGAQSAFDQASNQFRQGIQQGVAVNQLQNQYGGQMQQQAQRPLDMAYQDFQNQQNYPYQQLGFMSDLVRGMPLGQQSTKSMYQAPPSGLQTLGALGMGAYGAKQLGMFADGGQIMDGESVVRYADGGVTSDQNVEGILNKLSDEQLAQAKQAALGRRDVEQANMIDAEMAERASIRGGLGGAFNQIPEEQQEQMMAGGGIVAFAKRGLVEGDDEETGGELNNLSDLLASSEGNPAAYQKITDMFPQLMANVASARYKPMTDTAYNDAIVNRRKALEDGAGPSPYADYESKLAGMEAEDVKGLEQAKGLAAFAAIPEILKGNDPIRGIGGAGGAFAGAYGQALQADKAQKRSMMNMRLNLADAQRKERMGLTRDSIAAADQARKDHSDAQQFGIKKAEALASVAGKFATATKPIKGTGASGAKALKINEQLAEAEVAFENDPSKENRNRVVALRRAVSQTKVSDYGPTRAGLAGEALEAPVDRDALTALNKFSTSALKKREWQAMIKEYGSEEAARAAFIKNYKVTGGEPAPAKPASKAGSTAPGGGQKTMSMADVKTTAKSSGKTEAEVIDAAKKAGYTIQ
jgi:hypothetical protein